MLIWFNYSNLQWEKQYINSNINNKYIIKGIWTKQWIEIHHYSRIYKEGTDKVYK